MKSPLVASAIDQLQDIYTKPYIANLLEAIRHNKDISPTKKAPFKVLLVSRFLSSFHFAKKSSGT